jgi:Fe-S oxidoreductase
MAIAIAGTDERRVLEHTLALSLPRKVINLAISLGGKPGGGIGVWNAPFKKKILPPERMEAVRKKKRELDPTGILNPGMWLDGSMVFRPLFYHVAMSVLSSVDRVLPLNISGTEAQRLDREVAACVECGYCSNYCPTRGEWISSTPGGRIRMLKEISTAASPETLSPQACAHALFSCTLCGRCKIDCSVGINSPTMWLEARERLVRQGLELDSLKALAVVVEETGNIAGKTNSQRQQWAARLPMYKEISSKRGAEAVYFVGCVTSFYPTVQDIARSFARTLSKAQVDFMLLGGEEHCCGYPLISAGHTDQAVSRMKHNIRAVKATGGQTLLVTCPGCYRMWKHEYQRLTGEHPGIEVLHASEFVWRLIKKGRIRPGRLNGLFTYHDPCDLGRVSGIYEAPRLILDLIGEYVELEESREYSVCCGSGGDLLASNQDLSLSLAQKRLDQVQQTGADTVVTACPSCIRGMIMARTAAKRPMNILDITQIVWKAVNEGKPDDQSTV